MSPYRVTMLLATLFLSACSPSTQNKQIHVTPTTNRVAETNLSLGIAYLKNMDYEQSLEKLLRAKQADPRYAPTYNVLGLLYQQLGEHSKAKKHFKRALELNPKDSLILNNYGRFLCQQGELKKADRAFQKAVSNPLYATPEVAYVNAGLCAQLGKQEAAAEQYYRKALIQKPALPRALLEMTDLSLKQGKFLSARAYLKRYQSVAQHTPRSLLLGIRIEEQLGEKDALSTYALQLKNRFPDSEEAKLYKTQKADTTLDTSTN